MKIAKILPLMPVLNFRLQPIFVDDLVKVIGASLDAPANSTLNIVGVETVSCADMFIKFQSLGCKFRIINMPRLFSFLTRFFSFFPFSPIPYWQVKSLLSDEVFEGYDWPALFKVAPTPFNEGISKLYHEI